MVHNISTHIARGLRLLANSLAALAARRVVAFVICAAKATFRGEAKIGNRAKVVNVRAYNTLLLFALDLKDLIELTGRDLLNPLNIGFCMIIFILV